MADDSPASNADRELASRRRDLEREFDDKARELKAQHKRQMDRLLQDRQEWEDYKREQAKELADQAERYRRKDANKGLAAEAKADDRKELEALRLRVRELEERNLDARTGLARLDERVAKAAKAYAGTQGLFSALAGLAFVSGMAWVITALQAGDLAALLVAAVFLVATAFLWFLQRRLRPGRPTRT